MRDKIINILIVDDSQTCIQKTKTLIAEIPKTKIVGGITNEQEIYKYLDEKQVDLVIMDILMPTINGIELANEISSLYKGIMVIFATGYPKFALEGYKPNPIDFLVKPIRLVDIRRGIDKALEIKYNISYSQETPKIGVKSMGKINFVTVDNLLYVEKRDKKSLLHLADGTTIESNETLVGLERKLSSYSFFRSHQSFLVSVNRIKEIKRDMYMNSYNVKLVNCKTEVKLSKHKYLELKKAIDYL